MDWQEARKRGLSIVFTNGCFDLIHPGHVALLEQAKGEGDFLVVGLNSDASVRRLKGPSRPIMDQRARRTVLEAIRYVDQVIIFDEDTPLRLIEEIRPDVLVKGAEYEEEEIVGADLVRSYGGRVVRAEMVRGFSTSAIVSYLRELSRAEE